MRSRQTTSDRISTSPNHISRPVRSSSAFFRCARQVVYPSMRSDVHIVQLLLHLLPSPYFSLFVYLLSFSSQVALVREENGVGIEDLSKMFGARVFGQGSGDASPSSTSEPHPKSRKAKGKEKERNARGEVMMV